MNYFILVICALLSYFVLSTIEGIYDTFCFKTALKEYNEKFHEYQIPIPEKFKDLHELMLYVEDSGIELTFLYFARNYKGEINEQRKAD